MSSVLERLLHQELNKHVVDGWGALDNSDGGPVVLGCCVGGLDDGKKTWGQARNAPTHMLCPKKA